MARRWPAGARQVCARRQPSTSQLGTSREMEKSGSLQYDAPANPSKQLPQESFPRLVGALVDFDSRRIWR